MPPSNLLAATEALLFASDQPLSLTLLSESLEVPAEAVADALNELGAAYARRSAGVELREIGGGYMLVTAAEQSEWVGRMLRGKRRMRLSRPALETLAIIAYKQPGTRASVEAVRGVDASAVLATLLERNLVTIRRGSKVVGRPLLYGTTREFLDYFGLKDLSELPRPEELRALVAAREPEQLDMMELEVVSQVASDLAASEAASGAAPSRHEIEPLEPGERGPAEEPGGDDGPRKAGRRHQRSPAPHRRRRARPSPDASALRGGEGLSRVDRPVARPAPARAAAPRRRVRARRGERAGPGARAAPGGNRSPAGDRPPRGALPAGAPDVRSGGAGSAEAPPLGLWSLAPRAARARHVARAVGRGGEAPQGRGGAAAIPPTGSAPAELHERPGEKVAAAR